MNNFLLSVGGVNKLWLASAVIFSTLYMDWLQDPVYNIEAIIVAVTGSIAVLVTLYTVVNNSKNDAVLNLSKLNDMLTKQLSQEKDENAKEIQVLKKGIDKLSDTIEYERGQRIRAEDYIRALTRILADNKIAFPEYPKSVE